MLLELEPVFPELLTFYLDNVDEMTRCADVLGVPAFSPLLRKNLGEILRKPEALRHIEAVARHSCHSCSYDAKELESSRAAVSKLLRAKGISMPKGKRANPGLVKLVAKLTPLLLFYGVPLATGEGSVLVNALRLIANEAGMRGDPRDELRRLRRLDRQHGGKGYVEFLEAFVRGISPD